jgi:hypothetical protein
MKKSLSVGLSSLLAGGCKAVGSDIDMGLLMNADYIRKTFSNYKI